VNNRWFPVAGMAALVAGLLLAALLPVDNLGRWLFSLGGLAAFLLLLGIYRTGQALGVLVNDQHLMSLSRLQMVLWTLLVLSAYAAFVFARLPSQGAAALGVAVQPELYGLIGINTAALVGSPLVLSFRADKAPQDPTAAAAGAANAFGESAANIAQRANGPLYVNATPGDARFADIFEGDEIGNAHLVDLAKVQMFAFTVVSAVVWCVATYQMLKTTGTNLDSLPTLPSGMVTLLGVSNGGYLVSKGVSHTPS
jgi:hypothetical protein